jgi:hypothetical protein
VIPTRVSGAIRRRAFCISWRSHTKHNDVSRSENVQIICATPQAAATVLTILYAAGLKPVGDFTIQPILTTTPPLIFTMLVALTDAQVTKIRAVPDTTVT